MEKVTQARKEEMELGPALSAMELPRSTWYYHKNEKVSYREKYEWLQPLVQQIIADNPAYGVRRIQRELREEYDCRVNHKVLRRVLDMWDLSMKRKVHKGSQNGIKSAIRTAGSQADLVSGRENIDQFEVTVTDFTELRYAGGKRRAKLMVLLAYKTKVVYGWAVGSERNRQLALSAWERAKATFTELGISVEGMIVHHDRDSVYTSFQWLRQLLVEDQAVVSYAMGGAQDNTVMESFNGSFKRENDSLLQDAADIEELRMVVRDQIGYYNNDRRHSSIGYEFPRKHAEQMAETINE